MIYRTGTYIAFHANNTTEPTESDIKYFNLLKAWDKSKSIDFNFINSHEKTSAVRDTSKRATLMANLKKRLNSSKHMLLIIGKTTKEDTDWVPFEIRYAIDECSIPIIAVYTDETSALTPSNKSYLWPTALKSRIENNSARVIHIPFQKDIIYKAINEFNHNNLPKWPRTCYTKSTYQQLDLI
jgi:hypothetical protein